MKPFNLEEAKAGKPVCTRTGLPVRIICFDRLDNQYNLIGLIQITENNEDMIIFTLEGKYFMDSEENEYDLFMNTANRSHICIMQTKDGKIFPYPQFFTREKALTFYDDADTPKTGTVKIAITEVTWEEE
jgi:hypothetical protein